jgi:hypothetical protein
VGGVIFKKISKKLKKSTLRAVPETVLLRSRWPLEYSVIELFHAKI